MKLPADLLEIHHACQGIGSSLADLKQLLPAVLSLCMRPASRAFNRLHDQTERIPPDHKRACSQCWQQVCPTGLANGIIRTAQDSVEEALRSQKSIGSAFQTVQKLHAAAAFISHLVTALEFQHQQALPQEQE